MLDQLHFLATRMRWLQPLAVATGLLSLALAGYVMLAATDMTEALLIPAILGFCWSLVVYSLVGLFSAVPPRVDEQAGFLRRTGARFQRLFKSLLAVSFLGLTLTMVWLTVKLYTTGIG